MKKGEIARYEQFLLFHSVFKRCLLQTSKNQVLFWERFNVAKFIIPVFDRVENIVGKGENAGNQHFLLFPQCFQKIFSSGLLKVGIVWLMVNS